MDLERFCELKLQKPPGELLLGGFLAGAYIGFAGQLFTLVATTQGIPLALQKLLGGLVFSVGLTMVVLGKAELFTGNCLLVAHCLEGKAKVGKLLSNWALVYGGNFLGALFLALLYVASGLAGAQESIAQSIVHLVRAKMGLSFLQGFTRGVLCNWLVDLAVLCAVFSEHEVARILVIPGPIMTFVALGYEHSIANMYFFAAGILQGGSGVTWKDAFLQNLLPVTLGNIAGGGILVGALYSLLKGLARRT